MVIIKRKPEQDVVEKLRTGLVIDRNDLDDNIIQQPQLFFEVSEETAMAKSRADEAKDRLAQTDAELYEEFKAEPSSSSDEEKKSRGPTEAAIKAKVLQDRRHSRAQQEYLDASREAAMLQALKEAFDQRGRMLHELVALYVAGYFSRNSAKGGQEARSEMNRRAFSKNRSND